LPSTNSAKEGFDQAFKLEKNIVKSLTEIALKAQSFEDPEVLLCASFYCKCNRVKSTKYLD